MAMRMREGERVCGERGCAWGGCRESRKKREVAKGAIVARGVLCVCVESRTTVGEAVSQSIDAKRHRRGWTGGECVGLMNGLLCFVLRCVFVVVSPTDYVFGGGWVAVWLPFGGGISALWCACCDVLVFVIDVFYCVWPCLDFYVRLHHSWCRVTLHTRHMQSQPVVFHNSHRLDAHR